MDVRHDVRYLEISIENIEMVKILECQDDLSCVESSVLLTRRTRNTVDDVRDVMVGCEVHLNRPTLRR